MRIRIRPIIIRKIYGNMSNQEVWKKKVLQAGRGLYRPNDLSKVVVDVVGKWQIPDGEEKVFEKREKDTINIGDASSSLGLILEDAILTMKVGEVSQIDIANCEHLVDSPPLKQLVQPDSTGTIKYTIEMHSFELGKDVWTLNRYERLAIAKHHKTLGTQLFKENNLEGAAIQYSKALKYIIPVTTPNIHLEIEELESEEREVISLKSTLMLNLAACQLKFKQYPHVVENCNRVLELEPKNVKALYRRGQAHTNMNDFERAREDLTEAKKLEPGNRAIDEQLKVLDSKVSQQNAKYKDALKSMFQSAPGDDMDCS